MKKYILYLSLTVAGYGLLATTSALAAAPDATPDSASPPATTIILAAPGTRALTDNGDSKFFINANVGYIYNLSKGGLAGVDVHARNAVGYGGSFGWGGSSGWGVGVDYLGFNAESSAGTHGDSNYHVITLTPTYRIGFGEDRSWGIKFGLGLGANISAIEWSNAAPATNGAMGGATRAAGGAKFNATPNTGFPQVEACTHHAPDPGEQYQIYDSNGPTLSRRDTCGVPSSNMYFITNNRAIAEWLKQLGVTSATATTINGGGNFVSVETGGWGDIAPEIRCLVNGGRWYGRANDPHASYNSCSLAAGGATTGHGEKDSHDDDKEKSADSEKLEWGVVAAPQMAVEYDNGLLHVDVNFRYLYEITNLKFFDIKATNRGQYGGPLALFVGAGLGLNF